MTQEIKGYRVLSEDEKELINTIKEIAVKVGAVVETLEQDESLDQRWIAIGKTDLQTGFMAITRAIAQPETF